MPKGFSWVPEGDSQNKEFHWGANLATTQDTFALLDQSQSSEEMQDQYIQEWINQLEEDVNGLWYRRYGYEEYLRDSKIWSLSYRFRELLGKGVDRDKIKVQFAEPKVKELFRKFAHEKISDDAFAAEFCNDKTIAVLCSCELFPLSVEEVNEQILAVAREYSFAVGTTYGLAAVIDITPSKYKCLNDYIATPDQEAIKAGIQWYVYLIDEFKQGRWAYSLEWFNHCLSRIHSHFNRLPFLQKEWQSQPIQHALVNLRDFVHEKWWVECTEHLDKFETAMIEDKLNSFFSHLLVI
jgi:hypothetical protein